jgi:hypothetical protein
MSAGLGARNKRKMTAPVAHENKINACAESTA